MEVLLDKIEIFGFKQSKYYVSLDFFNRTTIIFGRNGVGKTSLLKILHAVFSRNDEVLLEHNIEKVILYTTGESISINININNQYEWPEPYFSQGKLSSLTITTDRGLNNYQRKINEGDLHDFFNNNKNVSLGINSTYTELSTFIDFLNGRSEKIIFDELYNSQNIYLENLRMNTIEKILMHEQSKVELYKLTVENMVYKSLLSAFKTSDNTSDKYEGTIKITYKNEFLKNIDSFSKILGVNDIEFISDLFNTLEFNHPQNDIENVFKKIQSQETINNFNRMNKITQYFNSLAFNNKILEIDSDNIVVKNGESNHGIDKLSHGERHLLTFLVLLSFIGENKSIIMIDEPCISLDTEWQEKFVDIVEDLCPNSQFIMTTHSPDIALNHPEKICNLELNER